MINSLFQHMFGSIHQYSTDKTFYQAAFDGLNARISCKKVLWAVDISAPAPGSKRIFLKLKEREAFDFAIVSEAAMVTVKNDVVSYARIVLGGFAPFPLRSIGAEAVLKGKRIKNATGSVCKAAVDGTQPLSNNRYKVIAANGMTEKAWGPSRRKLYSAVLTHKSHLPFFERFSTSQELRSEHRTCLLPSSAAGTDSGKICSAFGGPCHPKFIEFFNC